MAEKTLTRSTSGPRTEAASNGRQFTPRVDIYETDAELLLFADLPGVAQNDIDLRYENGELTLHAHVKPDAHRGRAVLTEFETGDFQRTFQLHEAIDVNRIEAEFKNGVLTVHLPKPEAVKPKQVQVRAG
jgi:HSP20 family protein